MEIHLYLSNLLGEKKTLQCTEGCVPFTDATLTFSKGLEFPQSLLSEAAPRKNKGQPWVSSRCATPKDLLEPSLLQGHEEPLASP